MTTLPSRKDSDDFPEYVRPKEALNPRGWWIIYVEVDEIIYVQYQECASVLITWAPSKINNSFLEQEYYYKQSMNYAGRLSVYYMI